MPISCLRAGARLLGLCSLVFAVPATAVTQIPQPLTLTDALNWAQQYNTTLRGAALDIERLGGQAIHADVAVPSNPRLSIEGSQRKRADGSSGADIGVELSQELWIAGQGGLRENAANNDLAAAKLNYAFLQATIRARTRAAFLSVLVAQKSVATAERVLSVNESLSGFADKRLGAGAGTQLEANTARLGLGRARAFLAQARNREARARLALKDFLALDPSRNLRYKGALGLSRLDLPDRDTLVTRAVQRRSDLGAAAQQIMAAQSRVSLARREIIPNLTVFGFYRQEGGGRRGNNRGANIAGGGISFDLPVLHRYAGERQVARAELSSAQLEQDVLQRDVRLAVFRAIGDYEAARSRTAALSNSVLTAAEQTLDLTQQSYAAGQVGAPAITAAQNNLFAIRRDYLDALDALVTAGTDLERATGGLVVMNNTATGR